MWLPVQALQKSPASSDTEQSLGWQMKQCSTKYFKRNHKKSPITITKRRLLFIFLSNILFHSIPFHSIQFYSILFYSILFYYILFWSILFYSILLYSTLSNWFLDILLCMTAACVKNTLGLASVTHSMVTWVWRGAPISWFGMYIIGATEMTKFQNNKSFTVYIYMYAIHCTIQVLLVCSLSSDI